MTNKFYVLDGKTPRAVAGVEEWAREFNHEAKNVAQTEVADSRVSTVFLGIDHRHGDGPPLLFETMIFGGKHDGHQDRCSTWGEAEAMHGRACALAGRP